MSRSDAGELVMRVAQQMMCLAFGRGLVAPFSIILISLGAIGATAQTTLMPPSGSSTATGRCSFKGMVSLNFDDGNVDVLQYAVPIMRSSALVGTFYVVTDRIGTRGYLSASDLNELQRAGNEIGAHTRKHRDLTLLSEDDVRNEVAGSKAALGAMGLDVSTFAYPFGSFNGRVEQAVKDAGFVGARSTNSGTNTPSTDRFALLRLDMNDATTLEGVEAAIQGAITKNEWLILAFHHVNGAYAGRPKVVDLVFFRGLAEYLAERQVPVVTNTQAISSMLNCIPD